jgi:hypothetical protein
MGTVLEANALLSGATKPRREQQVVICRIILDGYVLVSNVSQNKRIQSAPHRYMENQSRLKVESPNKRLVSIQCFDIRCGFSGIYRLPRRIAEDYSFIQNSS